MKRNWELVQTPVPGHPTKDRLSGREAGPKAEEEVKQAWHLHLESSPHAQKWGRNWPSLQTKWNSCGIRRPVVLKCGDG